MLTQCFITEGKWNFVDGICNQDTVAQVENPGQKLHGVKVC